MIGFGGDDGGGDPTVRIPDIFVVVCSEGGSFRGGLGCGVYESFVRERIQG